MIWRVCSAVDFTGIPYKSFDLSPKISVKTMENDQILGPCHSVWDRPAWSSGLPTTPGCCTFVGCTHQWMPSLLGVCFQSKRAAVPASTEAQPGVWNSIVVFHMCTGAQKLLGLLLLSQSGRQLDQQCTM